MLASCPCILGQRDPASTQMMTLKELPALYFNLSLTNVPVNKMLLWKITKWTVFGFVFLVESGFKPRWTCVGKTRPDIVIMTLSNLCKLVG